MLLYRVETRITLLRDNTKVTLAEQSFQSQTAFLLGRFAAVNSSKFLFTRLFQVRIF